MATEDGGLARASDLLAEAGARIDPIDAQWLLLDMLDKPVGWLFTDAAQTLQADVAARYRALVSRREAGEPVAYLTGRRGFWSLDLQVNDAVLIPRPETELLVELALARLSPHEDVAVADLGTGSGAIALAIAHERPRARVSAVDASADALAVAVANARRLQLANIQFAQGDWFAPLQGQRFALVASNPPYIASADPHLRQGDLRHEPAMALASGIDGLDAIRRIVSAAVDHLLPGGWLLLEHGFDQGPAVRELLGRAGFIAVETARDLEARDRVSLGRLR